ncbi:MAG: hypothetical protein ACXWIU_15570 [Limisphaerales bacterium]
MSKPTPFMRLLAESVIASEKLAQNKVRRPKGPIVVDVCGKLRPILGMLIGIGGYRVLLSRSLALATAEAPSLKAVGVSEDGALILNSDGAATDQRKLDEAGAVLIAHLLGLLDAFIGEDLTVQFIREAWPRLSFQRKPNFDARVKK